MRVLPQPCRVPVRRSQTKPNVPLHAPLHNFSQLARVPINHLLIKGKITARCTPPQIDVILSLLRPGDLRRGQLSAVVIDFE